MRLNKTIDTSPKFPLTHKEIEYTKSQEVEYFKILYMNILEIYRQVHPKNRNNFKILPHSLIRANKNSNVSDTEMNNGNQYIYPLSNLITKHFERNDKRKAKPLYTPEVSLYFNNQLIEINQTMLSNFKWGGIPIADLLGKYAILRQDDNYYTILAIVSHSSVILNRSIDSTPWQSKITELDNIDFNFPIKYNAVNLNRNDCDNLFLKLIPTFLDYDYQDGLYLGYNLLLSPYGKVNCKTESKNANDTNDFQLSSLSKSNIVVSNEIDINSISNNSVTFSNGKSITIPEGSRIIPFNSIFKSRMVCTQNHFKNLYYSTINLSFKDNLIKAFDEHHTNYIWGEYALYNLAESLLVVQNDSDDTFRVQKIIVLNRTKTNNVIIT